MYVAGERQKVTLSPRIVTTLALIGQTRAPNLQNRQSERTGIM
jgi:hypothetical protein